MPYRLKKLLVVGSIAFIPSQAFAQTSGSTSTQSTRSSGTAEGDANLATPTGHEVNVTIGAYKYVEPGDTSISIHGPKFGGGYTGTMSTSGRCAIRSSRFITDTAPLLDMPTQWYSPATRLTSWLSTAAVNS